MSVVNKHFGGILALFFQIWGIIFPNHFAVWTWFLWAPLLALLSQFPTTHPALNCFYQKRVILFSSPVFDLALSRQFPVLGARVLYFNIRLEIQQADIYSHCLDESWNTQVSAPVSWDISQHSSSSAHFRLFSGDRLALC